MEDYQRDGQTHLAEGQTKSESTGCHCFRTLDRSKGIASDIE